MSDEQIIELAVSCNLGRTLPPLGNPCGGDVFATDRSYRTDELLTFARAILALQSQPSGETFDQWLKREQPAGSVTDMERGWKACAAAMRPQSESEPFGYFRSHLWGWTDCGPDDEGAKALYERPQAVPMTEGTARQFVEWMKAQPEDREPTTIDAFLFGHATDEEKRIREAKIKKLEAAAHQPAKEPK